MKSIKLSVLFALLVAVLVVGPVAAASENPNNGMPAAHGVDGKTFGWVVSSLAKSSPGALAEHVSGGKAGGESGYSGGGMPAAHGVDGKTFGYVVSNLARLYPGAVAEHVSGK